LQARHATHNTIFSRLRGNFFRKTEVAAAKKLHVQSALLLSRTCFGSSIWPVLTVPERQRIHTNIVSSLRAAVSEQYMDHVDSEAPAMLTDAQFLTVYELRSLYSYVRFSRLRLSIRLALRAPIELLVLIYAARSDCKSWYAALSDDIAWMALCTPAAKFTVQSWFAFAQAEPTAARRVVRKACDSQPARSLTLAESRPRVCSISVRATCHCGKSFASATALGAHKTRMHGYVQPAAYYAGEDAICHCCLLQFGCRHHLVQHLAAKSPLCLLNTLLRCPPLSVEEEAAIRSRAAGVQHRDAPAAFRLHGPTWAVVDLRGDTLHGLSRLHPAGRGRGKHYHIRNAEWDIPELV
jgi:hypothetical protein